MKSKTNFNQQFKIALQFVRFWNLCLKLLFPRIFGIPSEMCDEIECENELNFVEWRRKAGDKFTLRIPTIFYALYFLRSFKSSNHPIFAMCIIFIYLFYLLKICLVSTISYRHFSSNWVFKFNGIFVWYGKIFAIAVEFFFHKAMRRGYFASVWVKESL